MHSVKRSRPSTLLLAASTCLAWVQLLAGTAANVRVTVVDMHGQKIEPCDHVIKFVPVNMPGSDKSARFTGCTAHDLPRGMYNLRFTTKFLAPARDYPCLVNNENSVCLVIADPGNVWWLEREVCVELKGFHSASNVLLLFSKVFDVGEPWSMQVGVDKKMQACITTKWLDLVITVVADRKIVGSTVLDRRSHPEPFTIMKDPKTHQLTAEP
jgi:hypothetical protein